MNKELAKDPYIFHSYQSDVKIKKTLDFLSGKILRSSAILDVGQRSPLTDAIEKRFGVFVVNTSGDLDRDFIIPSQKSKFNVIIYSHTIEHQFNPLHTLEKLREVLSDNGVLYIFLPSRPDFLKYKDHFHEIDHINMKRLLSEAGFEIMKYSRQKVWRSFKFYLTGIRPLFRLFFEYNAIYECVKK
ncbi:MAG: methyltransferase domain-containing protein [Bacteroidales bacterium]|jgi:SAM-dependent methyltransferase